MFLDMEVAHTKGQAVKNSTKKNLMCQLRAYQKFCDKYLLRYFPCDNQQICRFGQHLSKTMVSPESIGNYQSAVRTFHALLGLPIPDADEKQMKMFAQGIRRLMDHEVKQAEPITPEILLKISNVVKYTDHVEMVAWVATLIGFTMFLRKSNLVPDSMETFNPAMQFRRADFNLTGPFSAIMAEITWAKNIQFKQKVLRLPVLPVNNKAICPVIWIYYMFEKIPAEPEDPAFTIFNNGQKTSLSANQLIARIRKWLTLIKLPADKYSLHSLRRGGATFAHQCNIEGQMIKLLGNWASDCYKRYVDVSLDERYDTMKAWVEGMNKRTC